MDGCSGQKRRREERFTFIYMEWIDGSVKKEEHKRNVPFSSLFFLHAFSLPLEVSFSFEKNRDADISFKNACHVYIIK
jgi:hypothetical protein